LAPSVCTPARFADTPVPGGRSASSRLARAKVTGLAAEHASYLRQRPGLCLNLGVRPALPGRLRLNRDHLVLVVRSFGGLLRAFSGLDRLSLPIHGSSLDLQPCFGFFVRSAHLSSDSRRDGPPDPPSKHSNGATTPAECHQVRR
jgi:hypothetical protein